MPLCNICCSSLQRKTGADKNYMDDYHSENER